MVLGVRGLGFRILQQVDMGFIGALNPKSETLNLSGLRNSSTIAPASETLNRTIKKALQQKDVKAASQ